MEKLTKTTVLIKKWNKEVFGNTNLKISTLEDEVAVIARDLGVNGLDEETTVRLNVLKD